MEEKNEDLERFIRLLDAQGKDWTDAHAITQTTTWDRRYIASLASLSKGRVISSGSGYKLQDHATDAEVQGAIALISDKIAAMQDRVTDIIRHSHERLRRRTEASIAAAKMQDQQPTLF